MEHDQRDRREPGEPADETSAAPDSAQPSSEVTASPDRAEDAPSTQSTYDSPSEPAIGPETSSGNVEAAEIESWPSQDATSEPVSTDATNSLASEQPAWPTEAPAAGSGEPGAWSTQPPVAGSGEPDAWPTQAPERGDEPIREPEWSEPADQTEATPEPPPPEVEAYPGAETATYEETDTGAALAAATAAHSVPASEGTTGESTLCPRCGTENRPGLAFCRSCGQRLVAAGVATAVERPGTPEGTMACPRCGTHNRAGVAFCQNCGANLRGTAAGYVPPAVAVEDDAAPVEVRRGGAVLGPVVLLIGLVGIVTGYLLPFLYGTGSLFERASGAGGYGAAFWTAYPDVGAALVDQAYFGLTAAIPLLAVLLLALAVAGFMRATPGPLQTVGLGIALLWSVGLIVMFLVAELLGNWDGDLVGLLRVLTPAGIFFLSALIILIGTLTRFGRS